ncbi:1-deoxy-D-xylulose-5-phosphate reductoisomerase [Undibacterium oligocarboniphilum]|uniref:1-deoxy-D-xylulose 5-phosphate reductoisomerase n=1 Tax=Undibacterium oligocarboniphilum TaxID=666702 RepID=A0A850QLE7_9BURK|nr:1-deoxy-D-xylulose-5-phosphate reductoisomerase [Undibacterium oligocarboniphilum]MBC3870374.1 1-deoxy-D-xylulose-5-phosphate reductoisomerase [Undibacterium oligocarboniphilum]NVO78365.1 1-deoxy-D-xylulose-5-phosphate reductoisomerase [Undibacterium oligocarboniphilum]
MQRVCILGSTGSIGVSTLDVIGQHPDRYRIYALTAHTQVEKLAQQCRLHRPEVIVVGTAEAADALHKLLAGTDAGHVQIMHGSDALCEVASASGCDTVMAAIVGAAGLPASLAAARAGKKVLLANKEALVMSGALFMDAIKASGAVLLPIDSEHNAIFQCLPANYDGQMAQRGVRKILLTASGGPFLKRDIASLDKVTPEEAIAHPNWVMGKKISIDSATMMNKGLEVIEAYWLFSAPAESIEVVIHPQSVIHSMVSYADGSVLAQLGNPDMRTPIAYGLAYPERIDSGVSPLDLIKVGRLNFEAPDFQRFPCLSLAYQALGAGRSAPTILNASNEVAVQAFLDGKIGFRMIDQIIERCLNQIGIDSAHDLESILAADARTRLVASALITS